MPRSTACLFTSAFAAIGILAASAQTPPPASAGFQPQGEPVAIPGAPHCVIFVAAFEKGSWFDPTVPPDYRTPVKGTLLDSSEAKSDVRDIKRWLVQMMEQSPDMVAKAKAACEASGRGFIQIGIVRDDPDAGPGAWYAETPVILIDPGDIDKLGQNIELPGTGNASLENRAGLHVRALLPLTLVAHEMDHAKRAKLYSDFYTLHRYVTRLPNLSQEEIADQKKNAQKFLDEFEQFAVDDENTVIRELDDFKRSGYSRTAYDDGNGGIPFVMDTIRVRVNVAAAVGRVQHAGHEHRYANLDGGDQAIVEAIRTVFNREAIDTSTSMADPEKVQLAFTRFPLDQYKFDPDKAKRLLDQSGWTVGADGIRAKSGKRLKFLLDAGDANVPKVKAVSVSQRHQNAGGTVVRFTEDALVLSDAFALPSGPWLIRRPVVASVRRAPIVQREDAAPTVKAIFVANGRSSGPAFRMTMVYDGPGPSELYDPGFVLEPVQNVTAAQVEQELAGLKGRRVTATIDAYCLQMQKPPPSAGMVYRLARNPVQEQNGHLAPIMIASKLLQTQGQLHPDSDPANYFHSIRQWALWTHEQKFKDEAAFADAFVEHSRKNLAGTGRQWTRELEQSVRRLLPNRWRDITEVMRLAGIR